jgi:hypothetical protein
MTSVYDGTMLYVVSQHDGWEYNPIVKVCEDLEISKEIRS